MRNELSLARLRRGVLSIELIVSTVLLMTVMTFVTSMSFRVNQIWKQIGQQRIAVGELSNQLERLTVLSPDEIQAEIADLRPSDYCARSLDQPELVGVMSDDAIGIRVELKLNWQRRYPAPPIELTGWLPTASSNDEKKIEIE